MSGDPDPETSFQIMQGPSRRRRRRDRAWRALHRPDGGRPGDPEGGAPRARRRADAEGRARHGRPVQGGRPDHADRPDGLLQSIYSHGVDAFLRDAAAAGIDGLIVVDLPPEEDEELCLPASAAGLHFIRLATPTTDDRRLPAVTANTSGFVYYVSITGVTGAAEASAEAVAPMSSGSAPPPACRSASASA